MLDGARAVIDLIEAGGVVALTGAGISTASGIPGYRDHDGAWRASTPIDHRDFMRDARVRQRYWARSLAGWPIVGRARPSLAHRALAALEQCGLVTRIVTQNVDGLHQLAGSEDVVELHGAIRDVICLTCRARFERQAVQTWLEAMNPGRTAALAQAAPDGDAQPADTDYASFCVPPCPECAGVLMPDVVFFGGSVPRARVEATVNAIEGASTLLVLGTSLMVYSGYRFAVLAHRAGKPVVAVNLGRTRADDLYQSKVETDCDSFLATALSHVGVSPISL